MTDMKLNLCLRCEHRAKYLETKDTVLAHAPRYECKQMDTVKHICYAYAPTRPYIVKRFDDDSKPLFSSIAFTASLEVVEVGDSLKPNLIQTDTGFTIGYSNDTTR
jgi:hypothetical protein